MADPRPPPDECANCGATLPRSARACPECGADERSGWREQSVYDDLDLPDTAYADDDATPRPRLRRGLPWYWIATAAVLLIVTLFIFIG